LLAGAMKITIGILLVGLVLSVSTGGHPLSFATLSGVDSTTLANVMDDAIDQCGQVIESLGDGYHDFMASSRIVYFFKSLLPPDQKPGTIVLLGCGLVGLWGYGRGWGSGRR
jgi:hypothetical protein